MRGLKIIAIVAAATVVFTAAVLVLSWPKVAAEPSVSVMRPNLSDVSHGIFHSSIYLDAAFFDAAYAAAGRPFASAADAALAVAAVSPHHLFVKDRIAALFESFVGQKFDVVVLVGPDHFGRARAPANISLARWRTPYGDIAPDAGLAAVLIRAGAVVDESPFQGEHAITGLVPFVKRSLPGAAIVPVILRGTCSPARLEALAQALAAAASSERLLVIASVDFSHEVDAVTADRQDAAAVAAISAFDYARIAKLKLDSPPSIWLVSRYAELVGARRVLDLAATQSSRLLGHPEEPGTSHRYLLFLKSE